jgi:hypothetical protein
MQRDTWANNLSKEWRALNKRNEWQSEIEELFRPHMDQLTKAGQTPSSYVRRLVNIAQQLEASPAQTLTALAQRYGVLPNDGSGTDPVYAAHFHDEWSRFAKAHSNAEALRMQMGQVLAASPERQGETTADALERAYKAVSPEPRTADKPAAAESPEEESPQSSTQQDSWQQAAAAAWDEAGGYDEEEATTDAD